MLLVIFDYLTPLAFLASVAVVFSATVLFLISLFTKDEIARKKYKNWMFFGLISLYIIVILWVLIGWSHSDPSYGPGVLSSDPAPKFEVMPN